MVKYSEKSTIGFNINFFFLRVKFHFSAVEKNIEWIDTGSGRKNSEKGQTMDRFRGHPFSGPFIDIGQGPIK